MKMNVFEFTIFDGKNDIASCEDLDTAKEIALLLATEKHCNIDVINSFTGEVSYSLESYHIITFNAYNEIVSDRYEVKEREW